jgi:hypothetical protein
LFWDASAESLTLGQSNNFSNALANDLQVGTTSGSHGITIVGQNTASANLFFADNNNNDRGKISYSHASDALSFTVASSERMRIDSSGNVGIGTSSPAYEMDISKASSISPVGLRLQNSEGSFLLRTNNNQTLMDAGTDIIFRNSSETERMRIDSSGNVGIGTTSPSGDLHIKGTSFAQQYIQDNGTVIRLIASGGVNYIQSGTAISTGSAAPLAFGNINNNTEFMRLDTSGRLGIGTTSPQVPLDVNGDIYARGASVFADEFKAYSGFLTTYGSNTSALHYFKGNVGIGTSSVFSGNKLDVRGGNIMVGGFNTGTEYGLILTPSNTSSYWNVANITGGHLTFNNSATIGSQEKMRINAAGNLLVGTTDIAPATNNVEGIALRNEGHINVSRASGVVGYFNRKTNDGTILDFRKDGTTVGSIGVVTSDNLYIQGNSTHVGFVFGSSAVVPFKSGSYQDDTVDLGTTSYRFQDIYATNGTIQTSDRNEKQDIEALTDAETRVAVAAKGLLKKYRWKSAVEEKGDDARIHFGIMAQDLQQAFSAEGLDAGDYGMFISSTWTEKTRLGVRYNELLAFIIAGI